MTASSMLAVLAREMRPREMMLPSVFGRRYVSMPQSISASPTFDPDWKPWTRDVLDVLYRETHKEGLVSLKRSQIGLSVAATVMMAAEMYGLGGPMLYITRDAKAARDFADEYLDDIVSGCDVLARSQSISVDELGGSDRKLNKEFVQGRIDLVGAGTEGAAISLPRRVLVIDEYELSSRNFADRTGGRDLYQVASERVTNFKGTSKIWVFGHPGFQGEDIDKLFHTISDERWWWFDCPHCRAPVAPKWEHVHFTRMGEDGREDPTSAELWCPACVRPIPDGERRRRVLRPERGGTGRYETVLDQAVADRRPMVGLAVHGLSDPDISLVDHATKWVLATTEASRFDFLNKRMGEAVLKGKVVLRPEDVKAMFDDAPALAPPGTIMVVTGCDVQEPRDNPTCYCVTLALTPTAIWWLDSQTISGLAGWVQYNKSRSVIISGRERTMAPFCAGIDAAFQTGMVLDVVRESSAFYSTGVPGNYVIPVPMKFVPHLHADNSAIMAPEQKRLKPGMEHRGPLAHYYYMHRHTWVDRMMRMLTEGRVKILGQQPAELAGHLASQYLEPKASVHGLEPDKHEWAKMKNTRDDYLMAAVYALAAAVMVGRWEAQAMTALAGAAPAGAGGRYEGATPPGGSPAMSGNIRAKPVGVRGVDRSGNVGRGWGTFGGGGRRSI